MRESSIIEAKQKLNDYLQSGKQTIDDYCRSKNIDRRSFTRYLSNAKEFAIMNSDCETFDLIDCVLKKDKEMAIYKEALYKEAITEISTALRMGKDYNNGEPYGILDFYISEYRTLNLSVLSSKATNILNPEDKRRLSLFIGQDRRPMGYIVFNYTDDTLFQNATEVPVDGISTKMPDEIKYKALEIFKEYNIPKNLAAYRQLCVRLYKGIFVKPEENKVGVK